MIVYQGCRSGFKQPGFLGVFNPKNSLVSVGFLLCVWVVILYLPEGPAFVS